MNLGIDPSRVAEVIVTLPGGHRRRGTGYRVTTTAIVTAAHVLRGAREVLVRFDADRPEEWTTAATIEWEEGLTDVGVLVIQRESVRPVEPVTYGRLPEQDAVVEATTVGFPRFKLRDDPTRVADDGAPSRYRDMEHAVGGIPYLSNRREGTFELRVAPPDHDPDPTASPWEGMSGAALWVEGRVVGVTMEHHRRDGLGRLAASRVERWYETLSPDRLHQLAELIGLPLQARNLALVGERPADRVMTRYAALLRDNAPRELLGREEELADLVRFCAADDPYLWLQAGPWAGKSALVSSFALQPPAGVIAVIFFVSRRMSGQADSDAYLEAVVEQLAAVVETQSPIGLTATGMLSEYRRLLETAPVRAVESGQRLILVVDGLDEDESISVRKPSVASLLPTRPAPGLRILVTSRPSPGVPADLRPDHPLRTLTPRRLPPSPHAQELGYLAKHEFVDHFRSEDPTLLGVIGFIAAAGGGLSSPELAELIGSPMLKIRQLLEDRFGRSFESHGSDPYRTYVFAHETLREIAAEQLDSDVLSFRQRIVAWVDGYRSQHWPATTPAYAFRPFSRSVATRGDVSGLCALAADAERHDRMSVRTYGDGDALSEIRDAQGLLLSGRSAELRLLAVLAVERSRLILRNGSVPPTLPLLWARLRKPGRAEALARSIADPERQAGVLASVAEVLAQYDRDRADTLVNEAESVASSIVRHTNRVRALARVAETLGSWNGPRASAIAVTTVSAARSVEDSTERSRAMSRMVGVLGELEPDRAREVAAEAQEAALAITVETSRGEALARLAAALVDLDPPASDHLLATAAATVRSGPSTAWALAALAEVAAKAGMAGGRELTSEAERVLISADDVSRQFALWSVVDAWLEMNDWERAKAAAERFPEACDRASTLARVAKALAQSDQDAASDFLTEAERIARSLPDPLDQGAVLDAIAKALCAAQHYERAERIARDVVSPYRQAFALSTVAEAVAESDPAHASDLADEAERAFRVPDPRHQAQLLARVACSLADWKWEGARQEDLAMNAQKVARAIDIPYLRDTTLVDVARAFAAGADVDTARSIVRSISQDYLRDQALTLVTQALVRAEDWDAAETVARSIADTSSQSRALQGLAEALVAVQKIERAVTAARFIVEGFAQYQALMAVVDALVASEEWPKAAEVAGFVSAPIERSATRDTLVTSLVVAAEWDLAENVARTIAAPPPKGSRVFDQGEPSDEMDEDDDLTRLFLEVHQEGALHRILEGLLSAKEWNRAENLARSFEGFRGVIAIKQVLEAEMTAREWERARDLVDSGLIAHGSVLLDALVAAEEWSLAEGLVRSIEHEHQQVEAWGTLMDALIDHDEWDVAENLARSASDAVDSAMALAAIAQACASSDAARAARTIAEAEVGARRIADDARRAVVVTYISYILSEHDPIRGLQLLAKAEEDAFAIGPRQERASAFAGIAEIAAHWDLQRAEDFMDEAVILARSIDDPDTRDGAVMEVVATLSDLALWETARSAADSIEDPIQKATALGRLVDSLTDAKEWHRAEEVVRQVGDNQTQEEALIRLVRALSKEAQWDHAERVAVLISEAHRSAIFAELRRALWQAEEWDRAERVAESTQEDDTWFLSQCLVDRVSSLAGAHEWDRAEGAAHRIPDDFRRRDALNQLADSLAAAHEWDRAEGVARRMSAHHRSGAIQHLFHALLAAEEWDRAESLGTVVKYRRSENVTSLVRALADAQRWDLADAVTRRIPDAHEQGKTQDTLVALLAEADLWDRAQSLAASIASNEWRTSAFKTIAESMTTVWLQADAEGPVDLEPRLRRTIMNLLISDDWPDAMGPLGRLDPQAAETAVEAILLWSSSLLGDQSVSRH